MPAIAWKAPVWATSPTSEEAEDVDEPPDQGRSPEKFRRAPIRRQSEQTSLLTKAIMGVPEVEERAVFSDYTRRRSMASNVSIASTADLTSDTGLTSPARTNTPSPPPPEFTLSRYHNVTSHPKSPGLGRPIQLQSSVENAAHSIKKTAPSTDAAPRRCIKFACAGNPPKPQTTAQTTSQPMPTPAVQIKEQPKEAPRRTCIKFACADKPSNQQTPPRSPKMRRAKSPATPRAGRPGPAATSPSTPRQSTTPRQTAEKSGGRPKYLRANSVDLTNDGSQFHEFACEMTREADWIRQDSVVSKCKLTINDTLTKENHIRKLGAEAEEELEQEEEEAEAASDEDEDEDDQLDDDADDYEAEDDEDDDEEDDDEDEDELEAGLSDGYYTDEETGFASSDSEGEGEDGNMELWTLRKSSTIRAEPVLPPLVHSQSYHGHQSDSSITTCNNRRRSKLQRVIPDETTDLPDSTDFVCGTLDEDRPLEERYMTSLAARRKDKLRVIPQDIDPSFPASDPEDQEGEDFYNPVHHESDDDDLLGEMEDLHHDQDRSRRRRKSEHASPRRYHSPPPKQRHHSPPPPQRRGRSPKNLFDRRSPRRLRSPAPKAATIVTPVGSPKMGNNIAFNLAARPGAMTTKSLPRAGAMFHKQRRPHRSEYEDDVHIRGAIDIVKGLEKKRQRRKEKFYQKYCNRARRGQIPERKPQPGRGAERMKELGLLMAGKKDQTNYVLSI